MIPLTIDQQIKRQKEKGCVSPKEKIKSFLKTSSYYTVNYSYEQYLKVGENFTIKDFKWLEETNEKVARESLSLILRLERIVRNHIADSYSFYCIDNKYNYFSIDSFNVDSSEYHSIKTDEEKNKLKKKFIEECWNLYEKKRKQLNSKYRFNNIEKVPPFVIVQFLSFGQIRTFFKLLNKNIKEKLVKEFDLKISEFNSIMEKLNYLRNSCAHGDFILDFKTTKGVKIVCDKYKQYTYCNFFLLDKNKINLLPVLAQCSYVLKDDLKFFRSVIRNILEISNYDQNGSINSNYLLKSIGLKSDCKSVQKEFVK